MKYKYTLAVSLPTFEGYKHFKKIDRLYGFIKNIPDSELKNFTPILNHKNFCYVGIWYRTKNKLKLKSNA